MSQQSVTTTRILFTRHGQTEASMADIFSGSTDIPLTPLGHKQAEALAQRLSREQIDAFYCSPQLRALQTAAPVAAALGLAIQQREAFREMMFGDWEMSSRHQLIEKYAEDMDIWESGTWMVAPPNGETQQEVIARAVPCMLELIKKHRGETFLVLAHRTTLRLLLSSMLDMSLPNARALGLDTTALTEIRLRGNRVDLLYHNDTTHLSQLNPTITN